MMRLSEIIKDEQGKVPVPLIIVFGLIVIAAVVAFLGFQGIINIPGISPEQTETIADAKSVEFSDNDILAAELGAAIRDKQRSEREVTNLKELVELKDERIDSQQAEIARLEDLVELSDDNSVKDVAAVFEKMSPEAAVAILIKFEPEKTVLIMSAMEEKKSAPIMEEMDPDYAAKITEIMAGFVKPFGTVNAGATGTHPEDE